MRNKTMSINKRLAALGLAVAMVFTGVAVTDMGSVQAAQAEEGVYRVYGDTRYQTALSIAEQLRAEMGVDQFDAVIVATGENFADALSGSYLSYVQNAPILLINDDSANEVRSYIRKYLKTEGQVYVLGGEKAVPNYLVDFSKEDGSVPFEVIRLGGDTRYETNIEILMEAGVDSGDILVCTGDNFADSLSASAAKKPIFLVKKDGLSQVQKDYLSTLTNDRYYVLGGVNAVPSSVKAEVTNYGTTSRIAGETRYETSVKIAETFVRSPEAAVVAYAGDFPDGLCGGLLAALTDSAVILTSEDKMTLATDYIADENLDGGYVLGGTARFADKSIATLFDINTSAIKKCYWESTNK